MAETMWSEEGAAPKKRRIPTWAWFCGAGCLLALIVTIVGIVFLVGTVKKAMDPEQQWARIAEVLPYDERPLGWKPVFGMDMSLVGFEMFTLSGPRGEVAMLMHLPESEAEETREQLFDENFSGSLFGLGGRSGMKADKIEVQGRELRAMHFLQKRGLDVDEDEDEADVSTPDTGTNEPEPPDSGDAQEGSADRRAARKSAAIVVELTPPGQERPLVLQMIRTGSNELFTHQDIRDFLKPFHVGTVR